MYKDFQTIGIWILAFGTIAIFDPRLTDPWYIPKFFAAWAGLLFLWIGLRGRVVVVNARLYLPAVAFLATTAVSCALSRDLSVSILGAHGQPFNGLQAALLVFLAFIAAGTFSVYPSEAIIAGGVFMAAVAGFQATGIVRAPFSDMNGRFISTMGNPAFSGAVLSAILPFAMWRDWVENRWITSAAIAAGIILTFSRGPWAGAGIAAVVILLHTKRNLLTKKTIVVGSIILAVSVAAALSLKSGREKSDLCRIALWSDSMKIVEKTGPFGSGPDTFSHELREVKSDLFVSAHSGDAVLQASAHNDILQVIITLGWIGLAAYLLLCFELSRSGGLILAVFLALFFQAKFQPVPFPALLILAIVAGGGGLVRTTGRIEGRAIWAAGMVAILVGLIWSGRAWEAEARHSEAISLMNAGRIDLAADPGRRATEINPWNVRYAMVRSSIIWGVIPFVEPEKKILFSRRAIKIAADNVRIHPRDSEAHSLAATSYLLASGRLGSGLLRDARREIIRACELERGFSYLWIRRAEIASAMKSRREFDLAESEVGRIMSLSGKEGKRLQFGAH